MPLEIVRNDITKMKVDAIVNAAKESLLDHVKAFAELCPGPLRHLPARLDKQADCLVVQCHSRVLPCLNGFIIAEVRNKNNAGKRQRSFSGIVLDL